MQLGLAELTSRLNKAGVSILKQHRMTGRLATFFSVGSDERHTDIVISDEFLHDLPNQKEYQLAIDNYASAVAGRMKVGSPEVFFCASGAAIRVDIRWPIQSAVVNGVFSTHVLTNVTDQLSGNVAKIAVRLGFGGTSVDDVRYVVNRIRSTIDEGRITFYDLNVRQEYYQQVAPSEEQFGENHSRTTTETEDFIAKKAYILGCLLADSRDRHVWTQDPWDAEYLGVSLKQLQIGARTLRAKGLLELDAALEYAHPTDALLLRESSGKEESNTVERISRSKLPTKETLLDDIATTAQRLKMLALLVFDLDHFKQVNDTMGHSAGDLCLDQVVAEIGAILGRRGKLYRWGTGDEFAVLLPDFSTEEAQATAERIRRAIEAGKFGGEIHVTVSIGLCAGDQVDTGDAALFLDCADKSLYKSKQSGRNCVSAWSSEAAKR